MTTQEALDALGKGLAQSGMDADALVTLGAQVARGAKMLEAISLKAQAKALDAKAANLRDQASAAEQAAQQG